MRVTPLRITMLLLSGTLAVGAGFYGWANGQTNDNLEINDSFSALDYDEIHTFSVGKHRVAIETQSFSITDGDNGPANVIVSTGETDALLDSVFDNDLFADVRPAYVSWQDIDNDRSLDLLLWIPNLDGKLYASEYISSGDGRLHTLSVPMQRPYPEPETVWPKIVW